VNGTWSFGYDQLNRVTTANNSLMPSGEIWAQNFCWAYDSFGNRLQQTTSNVAFSAGTSSCTPSGTVYQNTWATFNAQNRMTSTNAPGWTITPPAYDGAGDVTNDGTNGYLYDAEGRICATHTGEGYFGYIYDAAGNRVAKGTISSTNWSCDVSTNGFALTECISSAVGGAVDGDRWQRELEAHECVCSGAVDRDLRSLDERYRLRPD